LAGIVEGGGRALEVLSARESHKPIPQVLALDQNENDEDDNNPRGGHGMYQRGDDRDEDLECTRIGLSHFDRNWSTRWIMIGK
jgi:hypothetical protein